MLHRQSMETRRPAVDEAADTPAGEHDGIARISDRTSEWTDEDREMWRRAHEPWWTPLREQPLEQ